MTRGVLLIAMGHENYIRMAVNLAASILYNDSSISIHLVHDGKFDELTENEKRLFSSHQVPAYGIWHNAAGREDFIKPKTRIYEMSPFDITMFLDVDMIWLIDKPISGLFNKLKGVEFTIMNEGPKEACYWADPEEIRAMVGHDNPMYIFYSELVYFEKSEVVKNYFDVVKHIFDNPLPGTKGFAGSAMPDELAFILASLKTGVLPHLANWLPIYWYFRCKNHRHLQPYQLANLYYGYSIGGNVTPEYAKAHYNNLMAHYAVQMGLTKPYKVRDKRSFISTRLKY